MHVPGTVLLSSWLESRGISYDLQRRYRKSGWLESIGSGAYKRPKERISWEGGIYALQHQNKLAVFPGALTALSLLGYSHYIRTGEERVFLFSPLSVKLPAWFNKYGWSNPISHYKTSVLPYQIGYVNYELANFSLQVSCAERAILEYLYLTPDKADLMEGFQIISGLTNLRPKIVQDLLLRCTSIKVKRLFLFMAEKTKHQWYNFIDKKSIELGTGDRSIVKEGSYNSSYKITIPKELANL